MNIQDTQYDYIIDIYTYTKIFSSPKSSSIFICINSEYIISMNMQMLPV